MIVEDSRQKIGKHENKHSYWDDKGTKYIRSALPFGDYWPTPKIAIDTKQDISEAVGNICGAGAEKARFLRECKKAKEAGCKLIILIEDRRYNTPDDLFGKSVHLHNGQTIPGDRVNVAMRMHEERYGVEFWFCDPAESGRVIEELLADG